jgi:hypothetical protein
VTRFIWTLVAILMGELIGIYAADVLAQGSKVSIVCRVSAIAEEAGEGRFQCIGDSNSVTLDVSAWDYMTDYLSASNGEQIRLTIEPVK